MTDGYKVERRRLQRHAAWLDGQRNEWVSDIPEDLHLLHTNGDEFTTIGADLVTTLEDLRAKYANDIVPRVSNLMAEVIMALHSVERNYGDAEEASMVALDGDRFPHTETPGDGVDQISTQDMQ
jgi:hypothetical protein